MDDEEAVKLYRQAAEQGLAAAQHSLGRCLKDGAGVAQDHETAARFFR